MIITMVLLFIVAAVGVILILRVFSDNDPCDNEYSICCQIIPPNRRVGINLAYTKSGGVDAHLEGTTGQPDAPTEAQLDAFRACIREKGTVSTNIVSIPQEPLGQVRNRWSREQDPPNLAWPPRDDSRLNLLRIGEATGTKVDIVARWCRNNSSCVKCDPIEPNLDTQTVHVSLRPDAKLKREEMSSTNGAPWPVPPKDEDGNPIAEAWQDIDDDGTRYFLVCQPDE